MSAKYACSCCVWLVFVVLLCLPAAAEPELPVYTTVKVLDGSTQPVYQLDPGQAITFQIKPTPEGNFARWKRYRWCTFDRRWFAIPIEQAGYYVVSGVPRKYKYTEGGGGFDRQLLGVYDNIEKIIRPGNKYSDVVKFPIKRENPDIFIFRGEPGQVWATQLVIRGSGQVNGKKLDYSVGAYKGQLLTLGGTVSGQLSEEFAMGLIDLDTQPGQTYELTADADADFEFCLLQATSPTAVRVLASQTRTVGQQQIPSIFCWTAEDNKKYLALVRFPSGAGRYEAKLGVGVPQAGRYGWSIIQDDDGGMESQRGQLLSSEWSLYKELILEDDPAQIKLAVIEYLMGWDPMDTISGYHLNWPTHPPETKEWPDLEVYVNENLVLKRPYDEVANQGWHNFSINPAVLKQGVNVVRFTEEDGKEDWFYLGVDLDTDYDRSYISHNDKIIRDELAPGYGKYATIGGHGEYMVRIKYMMK